MSDGLSDLEAFLRQILKEANQKDWDSLLPHPSWWKTWESNLLERWREERRKKNLAHQKESSSLSIHEGLNCRKF